MYKVNLDTLFIVLAPEFVILTVQIHPRQGHRGRGDPTLILQNFVIFNCRYGGLVEPEDVASLKYRYKFWELRTWNYLTWLSAGKN